MQDSNPQADGNAEARSHDEWRSDRSADTVLRDGARIPTPADGAGAGERVGRGGVGEKPFEGFAPTGPAPTPKDAPPDQTNECAEPGVTPSRCETGQNWPIGSSAPKLTQGATPARLENTKTYPAKPGAGSDLPVGG